MASIQEQNFNLKNGQSVLIRAFSGEDAQAMIEFRKQMSLESKNTMHYPGMKLPLVEESAKFLQDQFEHPVNVGYGAFLEDRIIGSFGLRVPRHDHPWTSHVGEFGMGILKEYWGQGLGKKFLEIQEDYARNNKLTRVQATVRTFNLSGIHLYLKAGFEIEGTLRNTALIDGKYFDEYTIAKILD